MFEIRELRHLLSIEEFRHFGRAARAVGLSQPALTKSLQRIEQSLGAQLFERSRRHVRPTAIGAEVLARARRLVEEAEDLKRAVDAMSGAATGGVTIGVGPAMSETYVAAAIAEVAQRQGTQIVVRVDNWQQLSDWLIAGEIDFYVADVGAARIDGRCHHTSLPQQQFVWYCRRGHPLAGRRRKTVSREDLVRFPIATPKMPSWATEWFAAAFGEQGAAGLPRPFPAVICESYGMLKQLVASSDCISAALRQTLASELADRLLVVLPVDAPELTTQAGIVRLLDRTLPPLAEELIAAIETLADSTRE
ncbi:MAG: LysR family transcriptional regulator [Pirellulaceae bacterium]